MIGAALDYVRERPATKVKRVVFVLFGQADYDVFKGKGPAV